MSFSWLPPSKLEEYVKWYKLVQLTVNDEDIIPNLPDNKIKEFISQADWLIIPTSGEVKKDQSKSRDNGNIWIRIENGSISFGISFTNVKSIDKLTNLLHPSNSFIRKQIIEVFSKLDDNYETAVYKKVKRDNFAQSPDYQPVFEPIKTNLIDDEKIDFILDTAKRVREEASQKIKDNPELKKLLSDFPDVSLMYITIDKSEEEFKKRILEMKMVYELCTQVKTSSSIKKELEQKKKDLIEMLSKGEDSLEEANIQKDRKIRKEIEETDKQLEIFGK